MQTCKVTLAFTAEAVWKKFLLKTISTQGAPKPPHRRFQIFEIVGILVEVLLLLLTLYDCALVLHQLLGSGCCLLGCKWRGTDARCPLAPIWLWVGVALPQTFLLGQDSEQWVIFGVAMFGVAIFGVAIFGVANICKTSMKCLKTTVFHSASPLWRNEGWTCDGAQVQPSKPIKARQQ